MRKKYIGAAVSVCAIWLGYFLVPNDMIFRAAVATTGIVATPLAFGIGDLLRKKYPPQSSVKVAASNEIFTVRRRVMAVYGWSLAISGIAAPLIPVLVGGALTKMLVLGIVLLGLGIFWVLSSRNVREIHIDDDRIQFLPVGASLKLSEVLEIKPSAKGGSPAYIELVTTSAQGRLVPGAILQWAGGCKLNIVGGNGDAILSALRRRLRTA